MAMSANNLQENSPRLPKPTSQGRMFAALAAGLSLVLSISRDTNALIPKKNRSNVPSARDASLAGTCCSGTSKSCT